ncbi:MAG TPA: tryptophan synthase subunit alpha [Thermoanaerobaculia bacterium]|nr:tryptophan synthase subunit alpha [Thermoanaerobaculia bacterium]
MNRVTRTFRRLQKDRRCGLVAYVTCGDPDLDTTVDIVKALETAGADCIELGVPFSDPIADGPVIQAASFRALQRGTTVAGVFDAARRIRESSEIPLVAFTYLNPLLRFGIERFAEEGTAAGIDAVLITDLPPEAAGELRETLRKHGVGMVFLVAPTSTIERMRLAERFSDGFVYYISTTGVTGVRSDLARGLLERLKVVREKVRKPLAVGFGVSSHEHYSELAPHCDAVVVGSAIVRAVSEGDPGGAAERAADVVRSILGR